MTGNAASHRPLGRRRKRREEVEFADDHGTDASYPVADQFKNGLSRFASASICLLQFIPAMNMVALFGLACAPLT